MNHSNPLDASQIEEAKARLRRVFMFLEERAKLDTPVENTIDRDAWRLRISDLPAHPAISGGLLLDTFDYGEERGDIALEVRRPGETSCPAPAPSIRAALPIGWDKLDVELEELFTEDPHRRTTFTLWRSLRDEWRRSERPNRRVIATYEHLFALRARLQRESERYRVLLGDGWLQVDQIAHPILHQELELELDERVPALRLRIANPIPELNTALLRTLPQLDAASIARARELVEQKNVALHDSEAVRELIEKVANVLFPNAKVHDELQQSPPPSPVFVQAPIVFLGSRAGTIPLAANRFLDALPTMEELPAPLVRVVLDLPESPGATAEGVEPLFTLPANREQEEILQRLDRHGSVVVQGPPGTGKTHTIANLIGHFLAEGKTVLVTSHSAKALRVVRDKVVPELQPLCVAYLESDLRGREQLEASVNGIVARLSLPSTDAASVARIAEQRARLAAELAACEESFDQALAGETDPIVLFGRAFLPREAAARVRAGLGRDDWIPAPIEAGAELPLSIADVHELYRGANHGLPPPPPPAEPIFLREPISVSALEPVVARALSAIDWLTAEKWLARCLDDVSRGGSFLASWDELRGLIAGALDAHEAFHPLKLRHEVVLPELDPAAAANICDEVIAHLELGAGLGWFARLGRGKWSELIDQARVDGRPPSKIDHFQVIRAGCQLRSAEQKLRRRWMRQMVPEGAPELPAELDVWPSFLEPYEEKMARAKLWWSGEWSGLEEELVRAGISREAVDRRLSEDVRRSVPMRAQISVRQVIHPALEALRRREEHAELVRSARARRRVLLDRLHAVAPGWVAALENVGDGTRPPGDVEDAWLFAQLSRALAERSAVDLDRLQQKIIELRDRLHRKTAELVARKAWTKQLERTSPIARRNLTGWLDHQKQIGKGTGKRAGLLQRKALELLAQCKDSVPVWIMPLSKVIESYDLARTRFDVVIIDEASQCDVNGLFAFGLARQIVVVGDDQQVSPLAVGQELDPIQSLIDLHLEGIPNKELYTGRLSIYDLARQSQSAIRLREHFRCVPEIIGFSSRLAYEGEIQALREGASARVRPPVVEHRVEGTCDERNVNLVEAIEVAALVAASIEQPEYSGSTMGVISLLGEEQWAQIERFLHAWLEPQEIERRRLLCGAPAHFQGDERDVVFVSTVWSSGGEPLAMNDNPELKKRLNVAASRARDQMWIVHSLNPELDLKPFDLRRRLIEHARSPGAGAIEGRPESELERAVLERLAGRGFRVRPRMRIGAYQLDLVVEGRHGRVAIECDGDGAYPAFEPHEDRARRRQLERAGWRFIRVRASRFVRDPEPAIDEVVRRLEELGVDPIGAEGGDDAAAIGEELRARVVARAAELRQLIWDHVGEEQAAPAPKRARRMIASDRPSRRAAAPRLRAAGGAR